MKDLAYYMGLQYTVSLCLDEEGDYVGRIKEFPGCVAHGSDQSEALRNLQDVQQAWIEEGLETGMLIPEPDK